MPRKTDSIKPADWIFIAESELEGVRLLAENEVSYSMCQSKLAEILEKVLKAELIRPGWPLQRTHDLLKLAAELQTRKSDLINQLRPLATSLAQKYFADRYPGFDLDDPDWPEFRKKVDQVGSILGTVKARIQ